MAYYRLPKDDGKNHESDSIQNQCKLVHAYLQEHPCIELIDEAYDDGYTGTNYDRPGFCSGCYQCGACQTMLTASTIPPGTTLSYPSKIL